MYLKPLYFIQRMKQVNAVAIHFVAANAFAQLLTSDESPAIIEQKSAAFFNFFNSSNAGPWRIVFAQHSLQAIFCTAAGGGVAQHQCKFVSYIGRKNIGGQKTTEQLAVGVFPLLAMGRYAVAKPLVGQQMCQLMYERYQKAMYVKIAIDRNAVVVVAVSMPEIAELGLPLFGNDQMHFVLQYQRHYQIKTTSGQVLLQCFKRMLTGGHVP